MKHLSLSACIACMAFGSVTSSSSAAVVWDEAVNGNLSNDRLIPTAVVLGAGDNTIKGSLPAFGGGQYHDYATFSIPSGYALVAVKLDALSSSNSGASYFGIAAGTTFPSDENGSNANLMLGFTAVSPASVGGDILPGLAVANNSNKGNSGFSIPLGAGTYSLWIQDYNNPAAYQISLVLEATVPPAIVVASKKVSSKQAVLSGSASGYQTKVSYRVGTKGVFKAAKGNASAWRIVVSKLKKGPNVVTVRAIGAFGTSTKKVTIVKK